MTRDEAIELRVTRYSGSQEWKRKCAAEDVDNYVALGMLKLDEPKSAHDLAAELIAARITEVGGNFPALEASTIIGRLESAGLKIVEK